MIVFNTKSILTEFCISFIEDIKAAQIATGKKTSGKSAAGLKYEADYFRARVIDSEGYIYFQEYGRAPGKRPPISKIQEWIDRKNLKLSAWGVAKAIEKKGTLLFQGKAKKLGLEDITRKNLQDLNTKLKPMFLADIRETIIKNVA